MAVTGVVLFGFVIGHMLGNLQVFLGPEAFNDYAAGMQGDCGAALGARASSCSSAVVLHIVMAVAARDALRGGAPGRLPREARHGHELRGATMKYSGPAAALLHPVPPGALHVPGPRPRRLRAQPTPTLRELRQRLQHPLGGRRSTSSRRCCSACTSTTALEHAAVARPQPSALQRSAAPARARVIALSASRRQHHHAASRAARARLSPRKHTATMRQDARWN